MVKICRQCCALHKVRAAGMTVGHHVEPCELCGALEALVVICPETKKRLKRERAAHD